jgi:hypothetical protein
MKTLLSTILISIATLTSSQTRNIKVNTKYNITNDTIEGRLNSQAENLDHCSIQILDSAKKVVKTDKYPKAIQKPGIKQWTELKTSIADLPPGNYTMVVYLGKEEMERKSFSKDDPKKKK